MNTVLSVQGASAPVEKKSFFSKFTRLNMLRLVRAVIPVCLPRYLPKVWARSERKGPAGPFEYGVSERVTEVSVDSIINVVLTKCGFLKLQSKTDVVPDFCIQSNGHQHTAVFFTFDAFFT